METIFALSTPFGKSGVAVFRISGPEAKKALSLLKVKNNLKPKQVEICNIFQGQQLIDKCIIIFFSSPHSFTGEDMLEIHTHGSIAVINVLVKSLNTIFRLAMPGEFSQRAFTNNKMNLIEAEGLADLIEAETEKQLEQAVRHTSGSSSLKYQEWRQKILNILSYNESIIDFTEEEIPLTLQDKINKSIKDLKQDMINKLNDNQVGEKIKEGFVVSIIGKPNVGKSSMINIIAKKDIAIVSHQAGTTRDIISVNINLKGYPITVYDTAGIRETKDALEKEGINRALKQAEKSDILIKMYSLEEIEHKDYNSLASNDCIKVISKIDDIFTRKKLQKKYPDHFVYSDKDPSTVGLILDDIYKKVSEKNIEPSIIIRSRHRKNIETMVNILDNINVDTPSEILAEELRICINSIGNITGRMIENDEVLSEIFSNFCIGK